MTPLVPVSRAVPTERTPLTLLPPSQPRPVNENENISKDATAVVDSNKSFASLFVSKNSVPPQQQQIQNENQNEIQNNNNNNNDNNNNNNNSNDRKESMRNIEQDRHVDKSYQNNNINNNDRNFPTMNANNRDRDDNVRNSNNSDYNNSNNNNNNNSQNNQNNENDLPSNSVARKRQLFDPKSNKMVDPEHHPDHLSSQQENKNSNSNSIGNEKNKKNGDLVPQGGPDSTKRPRPLHPRSDEFDSQWRRGVVNPKKPDGENGSKNNNVNANSNANFIPPSDLTGDDNEDDEDEVRYHKI